MKSLKETITENLVIENYKQQYHGVDGSINDRVQFSKASSNTVLILKDIFYISGLNKVATGCIIWENDSISMSFFIGLEKFNCIVDYPNSFWTSSSGEDYGTTEKGRINIYATKDVSSKVKSIQFDTLESLQKDIRKISKEIYDFCSMYSK
jgi:hypothetical protein